VRALIKAVVVLSVIFLALGLVACSYSVPTMSFGCSYEYPYALTGFVLIVGGATIGALGLLNPGKKSS
jgi:hypothetical protein